MSAQEVTYRGRRAVRIENYHVAVTVTVEGGHIAEFVDKRSGMNPLWSPPWPSIEPSRYDPSSPEYGANSESKLLAGILGHNLALDIFGAPSDEEYAAGITVHGEASVAAYNIESDGTRLTATVELPVALLRFRREIALDGASVLIREDVTNLTGMDRPIAWTQHVTLGPPFLEHGLTRLHIPARRSMVFPEDFGADQKYRPGAEFEWPLVPNKDGSTSDLSVFPAAERSAAVTCHLVDTDRNWAYFLAWHPPSQLLFGYTWRRADFPWISLWEENRSRTTPPWHGRTITRGVEFGVSPFAEGRRMTLDRGRLFETPTYRWLPARATATVEYVAFALRSAEFSGQLPAAITLSGAHATAYTG